MPPMTEPVQQRKLQVTEAEIALDRIDHQRYQLTVEEGQHVGEEQQQDEQCTTSRACCMARFDR